MLSSFTFSLSSAARGNSLISGSTSTGEDTKDFQKSSDSSVFGAVSGNPEFDVATSPSTLRLS